MGSAALALLLAAPLLGASPQPVGPRGAVTLFEGVTVLAMDGTPPAAGQSVVVENGVIAALGPASRVQAPPGATRIDARGKFLMPGLAEMHGHLPGPQTPPDVVEDVLFLFVANGVTTVRGMYGFPHHLELRGRVSRGELLGPMLYVASTPISGQSAKTPEDARRLVGEHKAAGFDLLKVHEGLSRQTYDAMVEAAQAAAIPFGGHVPNEVGLLRALEARQATVDHVDGFLEALEKDDSPVRDAAPEVRAEKVWDHLDEGRIPGLARKARDSGTWVVPTQALWQAFFGAHTQEALAAREELRYVPQAMREQWRQQRANQLQDGPPGATEARILALRDRMLKALADEGAGILLGSDAPQMYSVPGFSLHREMDAMVRAGLTPLQVLESGTRNVAAYLGPGHAAGTIAVGRQADFLLLEADPLQSVASVARRAGVMVRGRWLPESEIQARLAAMAARRAN